MKKKEKPNHPKGRFIKNGRIKKETIDTGIVRKFSTGATRDTSDGKYDYEGFLSPIVIQKYAEYMHSNRKQSDGSLRAGDNWQKHFGEHHYTVCMKSMWRHFMDLWLENRNFKSREGIESALMGILFNVMAYADKYYKDKLTKKKGK